MTGNGWPGISSIWVLLCVLLLLVPWGAPSDGRTGGDVTADTAGGDGPAAIFMRIYGSVFIDGENVTTPHDVAAYADGVLYAFAATQLVAGNWWRFDLDVPLDDETTKFKDGCYADETITFKLMSYSPQLWSTEVATFSPDKTLHTDLHFSSIDNRPSEGMVINEVVNQWKGGPTVYSYIHANENVDIGLYRLTDNDGHAENLEILAAQVTVDWPATPFNIFVNLTNTAFDVEAVDELKLEWRDPLASVAKGEWVVIDRFEWGHLDVDAGPDNTIMADYGGTLDPATALKRVANGSDTDDCFNDLMATEGTRPYKNRLDAVPPASSITDVLPPYMNTLVLNLAYEAQDFESGFGRVDCWYQRDGDYPERGFSDDRTDQGQGGELISGLFPLTLSADGYYQFWSVGVDKWGNVEARPDTNGRKDPGAVGVKAWDSATIIDTVAPTSSVTGGVPPVVNSQGPWNLTMNFADTSPVTQNTSGVYSVTLYAWTPSSGAWVDTGIIEYASGSDGVFGGYALADGDGMYHFAAVAADNAGNVEGGPTAIGDADWSMRLNTNSYSVNIVTGWNLISVPNNVSGDIVSVLDDMGGDGTAEWNTAQYYDVWDPSDPWKIFSKGAPSFLNDLTTVNSSMAVWVRFTATGDGLLTINGTRPVSTTIIMKKGWNFVGYPSWKNSVTVSTALAGQPYDIIQTYSQTNTYHLRDVASSEYMSPGAGYWIHFTSDSTWTVQG